VVAQLLHLATNPSKSLEPYLRKLADGTRPLRSRAVARAQADTRARHGLALGDVPGDEYDGQPDGAAQDARLR
jgi:hypothetical protein